MHLCWFSTYCHLHVLTEKPFKMSNVPTFVVKYIYLPFVLRTPFSVGKKYLRRAKISVENSETRKRYDTCGIDLAHVEGISRAKDFWYLRFVLQCGYNFITIEKNS